MNPDPLIWNPYAVLGLPEWPDLDDETVRAAWQQIADETHPDRADGGDLARYTRATAAYNDLCCPWGRTEAYADLVDQAQRDGRWDAYPDPYPPGWGLCTSAPPPGPYDIELGPIPLDEILRLTRESPARLRHGHPGRMAIRALVIAGLCLTVLALFPRWAYPHVWVAALTGLFLIYARQDIAPPARPARRLTPPGKT
ncbi:MAG: J domain-containing protein [Streptosporangiaceae bacterium]